MPITRLAERERESVRDAGAAEQRAREGRGPWVKRDGIDIGKRNVRLREDLLEQRQGPADMVARCKLGHYAAVLAMHGDLRMERMREQSALRVVERETGFIAGAFETEDEHGGEVRGVTAWPGRSRIIACAPLLAGRPC